MPHIYMNATHILLSIYPNMQNIIHNSNFYSLIHAKQTKYYIHDQLHLKLVQVLRTIISSMTLAEFKIDIIKKSLNIPAFKDCTIYNILHTKYTRKVAVSVIYSTKQDQRSILSILSFQDTSLLLCKNFTKLR